MSPVKKLVAVGLGISMLMPVFVSADTATSSVQTLLEQIKALQLQMQTLQQQQQQNFINLAKTLKQGQSGDDVKALQALLAADPTLYPEGLISGFFGPKTAEAVKRFQKKHGLDQVGRVGPMTLKKLNELFGMHRMKWDFGTSTPPMGSGQTASSTRPNDDRHDRMPCFVNPAGNSVPLGWFRKDDDDKGRGRGRDDDRGRNGERGERNERWIIRPCGNGTTTPPVADTVAPVISSISVSSITNVGASVSWNTNENATSKVYVSTTSPVSLGTTWFVANASLVGAHTLALSGLTPSTTYYYVIESKDAANNTATTSTASFATIATPDTTAPVISGAAVSSIATTSATVAWNTNENATGKVYYSTSTPVDLLTALTMSSASFTSAHSFGLTSLSASTTYFYVLESKDAANNTATTSSSSFVTTN